MGFPGASGSQESACNAGDLGLIPGSGGSLGEGLGNPLQYSCLENPMDRGAWWSTVYGMAKEWDTTERLTHSIKMCTNMFSPLLYENLHKGVHLAFLFPAAKIFTIWLFTEKVC